ncbi:VWA domain-containing protein [Allokutzneria multivorans]|uniref:VWA domain-containing protein n=1 Tax=Allokutzneria multivorans TaxID=1142134 RepID=A0ABP7RYH6_9PSEU
MFGLSVTGFAHPWWFLLFVAVVALLGWYLWAQRRRKRNVMRFTNLELLEKVAPKRQGWVRHVAPALLLVSMALLTVAMTGPTGEQRVPRNRATVMLVIDVSLSMKSTDVKPDRLTAAQNAAKAFADGLTPGVNLGLISFAGSAAVVVAPTAERAPVKHAIDNLRLGAGTATGDSIASAVAAVDSFGKLITGPDGRPPSRIVLMSDGKQTIPASLDEPRGAFAEAKNAKNAGMPISAISFGTEYGSIEIDGRSQLVPVDDDSMKQIATLSGGDFHKAATESELRRVYDNLGEQIGYETKRADASRPWVVLGTLTLLIAAAVSLVLGQRIP